MKHAIAAFEDPITAPYADLALFFSKRTETTPASVGAPLKNWGVAASAGPINTPSKTGSCGLNSAAYVGRMSQIAKLKRQN